MSFAKRVLARVYVSVMHFFFLCASTVSFVFVFVFLFLFSFSLLLFWSLSSEVYWDYNVKMWRPAELSCAGDRYPSTSTSLIERPCAKVVSNVSLRMTRATTTTTMTRTTVIPLTHIERWGGWNFDASSRVRVRWLNGKNFRYANWKQVRQPKFVRIAARFAHACVRFTLGDDDEDHDSRKDKTTQWPIA